MMNDLEIMEMQIDSLKKVYKINLERKLESLIKNLQMELKQLKENPNYNPNSCGIVQSDGMNIDELCIKLGTLDAVKQS